MHKEETHIKVDRYGARIEIVWPFGVEQHPRVKRVVMSEMNRTIATDLSVNGLGLICALKAQVFKEAEEEGTVLSEQLINRLGLGSEALRACIIFEIQNEPIITGPPPHLRLVD